MGKICKRCHKEKDISCYTPDKRLEDGHKGVCKVCVLVNVKKYQETEKGKRSLMRCSLKKHHNMTIEQYNQMLQDQDGVCKICGSVNPNGARLSVDHDHATGRIRGLLCITCNRKLAIFEQELFAELARNYLCI